MSFSARHVPAVVFAVLSLAVPVCAQSTTTQARKPRGSISGRITIKDKGAAGVAIGVRRGDAGFPLSQTFEKATTDHDGYYRVGNLTPGTYEVAPSVPAYVVGETNNRAKQVIVAEDENVEGINFSLVRGGVITGKVTDADGRPLIQQQVSLYRSDAFQPQSGQAIPRPAFATTSVMTDDRGVYRMYGLAAGSYKVASGRTDDAYSQPGVVSRTTYKRVFHPDATEESRATVIVVTEGSETGDVDIALGRTQPTFSASGRIIDEKGLPVPNQRFGLQRAVGQRFDTVPTQTASNSRGEFVIEGLTPAKYGLFLFPNPATQNQYPDMRAESATFDVIDRDVTDVTVRLVKGASLSGVIALESNDKAAIQRFQQLQLRAYVMSQQGGQSFGNTSGSPISVDGSFRLGGLPGGIVNMYLSSPRAFLDQRGFTITRVERDGIAVPSRGIELKDGEQVTGIRVTVIYATGSIRGVVKVENGTLPTDAQVYVRLTKPGESLSNLPSARVDARGHFLIEALPAGLYELHTSIASMMRRQVKQEVTVQDGAASDVVVTIDLGTTPK